MKQKTGFTLIELLIVIAIISALAAMVFAIGHNIMLKSKIENTHKAMLAITLACSQYQAVYYRYPVIDRPVGIGYEAEYSGADSNTRINGGGFSSSDFDEYNRRLRFMLEEKTYLVGEKREGPFITESLPNDRNMFIDSWGNPLRICPGRNHNKSTNKPLGPNYYDAVRENKPLDIFSYGPDETLDAGLTGSEIETDFDTTTGTADDIVAWLMKTQYSEKNYNK